MSVYNTVNMSAVALRRIMGQSFDSGKFEQGRQEAKKFLNEHPEQWADKLAEVKRRIESCDFEHTPDASYWIGCLSEADFS